MSEIGRIKNLDKTIKYCIDNFDDLDLDKENLKALKVALESYKGKVISNIVATSLNNKPQTQRQISETLVHLKGKRDEKQGEIQEIQEEIQGIEKEIKKIQREIQKIEERKKMEVEPEVELEFQKRKHENVLRKIEKEIQKRKKNIKERKQDLKDLEQDIEDIQADIKRINEIIKCLDDQESLVRTLINRDSEKEIYGLVYECIKRLESNGINVGLQLIEDDGKKVTISKEDVEVLGEIATDPSLIQEIKEYNKKKHQIIENHSTSQKEDLVRKKEEIMDDRCVVSGDVASYMEDILKLYDSALKYYCLKHEDEVVNLDSKSSLSKVILKIFAKNKYEEQIRNEEEQRKKEADRKDRIEELKETIEEYSGYCNGNTKAREVIRNIWKYKIEKDTKKDIDTTTREEYSEMQGHEELNFLLNYINQFEDRQEVAKELVDYAKSAARHSIRKLSVEISKSKAEIENVKKDEKYQIKQLNDGRSEKVKKAMERGLDPEKIDNLEILKEFESKTDVVPAVDLLILYTLLKEENINTIMDSERAGYKLDLSKVEEEIKKGEEKLTNFLGQYEEKADGR